MKTGWHAYLEEDELGRGFVFIQKGDDKRRRETYSEFAPAEMEDERDMVDAFLHEAHVIANSRNSESDKEISS